jgi:hypothetical protein
MKFLFDMTNIRILGTSKILEELLFDEDTLPAHLKHIWSFRVEGIDDPLFLGSRHHWHEMNLRKLYTWMKIEPPLTPTKMNDAAIMDMRQRIRAAMAAGLRLEPSTLPILEASAAVINAPPPTPRAPRMPNAQRGSVGPIIHRVATEMWEAAGSPKDTQVILQLRQTIMKTLNDEHKIKTTTSSNELGRWQKQLLAG